MGLVKMMKAIVGIDRWASVDQDSVYMVVNDEVLDRAMTWGLPGSLTQPHVFFGSLDAVAHQMDQIETEDTLRVAEVSVSALGPKTLVSGDLLGERASNGDEIYLSFKDIPAEAISEVPDPRSAPRP